MSIYSGPNPNLRNIPNGVPNLAVPEGSPSLFIDFVNNNCATVNNGIKTASSNAMSLITFTRSSNASYTAANGTIQYVANNIPRFDYDPVTGYCKGLLIEEQRTNLQWPSIPVGNSANFTVTPNYDISPDGKQTASRFVWSVAGGDFWYGTFQTIPVSATYTASAYLKSNTGTGTMQIRNGNSDGGFSAYVVFNYASKTITTASYSSDANVSVTSVTSTISPAVNGWYRISVTGTFTVANSAPSGSRQCFGLVGDSSSSGDWLVWGAQLEVGSFATSLIPTTTTTVTRVADYATFNTNSSWYNTSQGTIYANFSTSVPSNLGIGIPILFFGSTTGSPHIYYNGGTFYAANYGYAGSATYNNPVTFPNSAKVAYGYQPGNSAFTVLGTTVTNTDSNSYASNNPIYVGTYGGAYLNGYMKQIAYYPTRISNTSLQQITS